MLEEIQEIFRDVLDNETLEIDENTAFTAIEGWDSLVHVRVVMMVERHFKMKFKIDEITELKGVGDITRIVKERK